MYRSTSARTSAHQRPSSRHRWGRSENRPDWAVDQLFPILPIHRLDTEPTRNAILADLTYVVYHRGLEDTVRQILNSELVPELATNAINVVRGAFTPIKDPYIAGAAPNLPWWAFPDWRAAGVVPFVLARRQGMAGPMIARKKSDIERVTSLLGGGAAVAPIMGDFHTRNIELLVMDVWGTYVDADDGNFFDTNGGYYSSGTAP